MAARKASTPAKKATPARKAAPAKKAAPTRAKGKSSRTEKTPAPLFPPGRKPSRIDPELIRLIAAGVRSGMFPTVACRAAKVQPRLHRRWMERGLATLALIDDLGELGIDDVDVPEWERPYLAYAVAIEEAAGQRRGEVEAEVSRDAGAQWLRWGPGRDRGPDDPGWTNAITLASPDGGPLPSAPPAAVVVRVQYVDDLEGATD